jgi:hypothetical protein
MLSFEHYSTNETQASDSAPDTDYRIAYPDLLTIFSRYINGGKKQ